MTKEQLNKEVISALKQGDKQKHKLLSTLKGEVELLLKKGETDFEKVLEKLSLKFSKDLKKCKPDNWEQEVELLKQFLPKLPTNQELKSEINKLISIGIVEERKLIGNIMKTYKGINFVDVENLVKQCLN